jgi:hypothetical protein
MYQRWERRNDMLKVKRSGVRGVILGGGRTREEWSVVRAQAWYRAPLRWRLS